MPSIPYPTVDPAFIAEVGSLTDEANETLRQVVDLSSRVGHVIAKMDEHQAQPSDLHDNAEHLRKVTGHPDLLTAMYAIAGQAAAAADHSPTDLPTPSWYDQLLERRRARWEQVA